MATDDTRTATKNLTPQRLQEIRERVERATPGPWVPGQPLFRCVLDHGKSGHGGRACRYTFGGTWYGEDHLITSAPGLGPNSTEKSAVDVAGNYDYEAGGIVNPNAVPFIAHARQDIPDLLADRDALVQRIKRLETAMGHVATWSEGDRPSEPLWHQDSADYLDWTAGELAEVERYARIALSEDVA